MNRMNLLVKNVYKLFTSQHTSLSPTWRKMIINDKLTNFAFFNPHVMFGLERRPWGIILRLIIMLQRH